jgi:hypothetical protein
MRHLSWESATVNVVAPASRIREDIKSDKCDALSEQQCAVYFLFYIVPCCHIYLKVQTDKSLLMEQVPGRTY